MTNTRTQTFSHAITGVLARRAEMMEEIATIREQLAVLSNDVEAVDRVLETLPAITIARKPTTANVIKADSTSRLFLGGRMLTLNPSQPVAN